MTDSAIAAHICQLHCTAACMPACVPAQITLSSMYMPETDYAVAYTRPEAVLSSLEQCASLTHVVILTYPGDPSTACIHGICRIAQPVPSAHAAEVHQRICQPASQPGRCICACCLSN